MREAVAACDGKPSLAVTSPAGKHFMPGDAELERIGIKLVVYPQEILAATVHAVRAALAGLKGGAKPPMASPAGTGDGDPLGRLPGPRRALAGPTVSRSHGPALRSRSCRRSPKAAMPVRPCAIRSTWRGMSRRSATGVTGWPSITTCPASPAPRPRWRSPMSPPAPASIRIGAGGIMLPNHAPLLIAEQFGTLAALHPGRVELGLGRAPGSDQITARAVRRALLGGAEQFPQDVVELMGYFQPAEPDQAVQAVPGAGLEVPIWILGSSLFGAQLAAYPRPALRLRLAFRAGDDDGRRWRSIASGSARRRSSPRPNVMLGVTVVAAETDDGGAIPVLLDCSNRR